MIRVITGLQDVTIAIDNKIMGSEFLLQVLAQKVRPIADPLVMFLKVRLYPPKPSTVKDTTVQVSLDNPLLYISSSRIQKEDFKVHSN
ncbi:hypothetical protein E2C01_043062 [Portunus trituberculatus]|uniref:Uncharacterized protein n=1 Tax=Portunus trituberculatus TaxID=210409 RepID=A0A5B7FY72_PORTR|nr:hypothetical protein [Portunus trituberculatus]